MSTTLYLLGPEIVVLVSAFGVLLVDLLVKNSHRAVSRLAIAGLLLALACTGVIAYGDPVKQGLMHPYVRNVLVVDSFAIFFKFFILFLTLLTVLLSYNSFEEEARYSGEYYTLLLFTTLGEMLAVSSQELLTFFLCFELLSLPLYMLAGFRRYSAASAEAGLKYFLTGALSSAIMLYGMSFVYGSLGTTVFPQMASAFQNLSAPPHALLLGLVMIAAGLAFKVSAAPFHNWAPDVYSGAPSIVGAYLSTAPKAAMVAVFIRLYWDTFDLRGRTFSFTTDWVWLFAVLALLSMVVGNLSAIPQKNVKKMLAYSGIAQMGYIFLGVTACSSSTGSGVMGAAACCYYVAVYGFANLAVWAVLALSCSQEGRREELRGLARRSPLLALVLAISVMSLAGVPPLAGFVGKFTLFRAIYESQWPALVLLGIVNSAISLYYYFLVLREAYFFEPAEGAEPIVVTFPQRFALQVCLLASLALGLWPGIIRWGELVALQLLGQTPQ